MNQGAGGEPWYDFPYLQSNAYQARYIGGDTPHYALDMQTPFHTVITAPTSGTVKVADYQQWGGEIFVQPDSGGPEWYFYHPDEVDVHVGEHVDAGQPIALSGGENPGFPGAEHPTSTRYSSGPHTHFGLFTKFVNTGDPVGTIPFGPDPRPLLQALRSGSAPPIGGSPGLPTQQKQLGTIFNPNNPSTPSLDIGQSISDWISANISPFVARAGFMLLGGALIIGGIVIATRGS